MRGILFIAFWQCLAFLPVLFSHTGRVAGIALATRPPHGATRRQLLLEYSRVELEKIREKWIAMRAKGEPLDKLLEPPQVARTHAAPPKSPSPKRVSPARRSEPGAPHTNVKPSKAKSRPSGKPAVGPPPRKPPLSPAQAAAVAEHRRLKALEAAEGLKNATCYIHTPRQQRLARLWEQLGASPRNDCVVCFHYMKGREGIFTDGLRNFTRANHSCSARKPPRKKPSGRCDWWISWGIKHLPKHELFQASYPPMIILDMVHFRGLGDKAPEWMSMVWSGFNGYGFRPRGMDGHRWETHFAPLLQVKPWQPPEEDLAGRVVAIIGQMYHDTALMTVKAKYGSPNVWYQHTVDELRRVAPLLDIRFRPHPTGDDGFALSDGTVPPRGATLDTNGTLADLILRAYCVVTMNSNAAIESVLAGTPAIVTDEGSMAWDVAVHNVSDIHNLYRGDRMQWLHDLSYAQWRFDEVKRGALLPIYFDPNKVR